MSQTLEVLSRRMTTLQSIRGVVRTMKTLSAVNAAPYEAAAVAIDRYHATILDGLHLLIQTADFPAPPDQIPSAPGIMVVFGSDHGLCGGYNEGIAESAVTRIGDEAWTVFSVGAKIQAALQDRGFAPARHFHPPASPDGIGRLAAELLIALDQSQTASRRAQQVLMTHVPLDKGSGRQPTVTPLLPLDPDLLRDLAERPWESRTLPLVTMPPEAMFAALVRNHLFASVFRAAAEAMAMENAARLALMQQAERELNDRLDELLQTTRSARQSAVTSELLDVIAGFEALRKTRPRPEAE